MPGTVVRQRTVLVGRDRERRALARLLAQNAVVTIHGAAGVGKTVLALHTLHELHAAGRVAAPLHLPLALSTDDRTSTMSVRTSSSSSTTSTQEPHPLTPVIADGHNSGVRQPHLTTS